MNVIDLQRKIYHLFGRKIKNSTDCNELAENIYIKTQKRISSQTIKRFFSVIQDNTVPSPNTILILSEYVSKLDKTYLKNKMIFDREIEFILDFYNIELYDQNDFNYQLASANISKKVYESEFILNQVFEKIAQKKAGQIYFFERFPFEDLLCNKTYINSLELYKKYKKKEEAIIYSNSLILKGYFLSKQKEAFLSTFNIIKRTSINKEFHPFIQGRVFANQLMLCHFLNLNDEFIKCVHNAKDHLLKIDSSIYFPFFEYIVIEALIITNRLEHIHLFSNVFQKVEPNKKSPIESGYYEALKIFNAYFQLSINNNKEAKLLLKKIKNTNILFFHKKYMSILIEILKIKLNIEPSLNKKTLNNLIKETNYTTFYDFVG
jgi:hypothetical protein